MKKVPLIIRIVIALVVGIGIGLICKSIDIIAPIRLLVTFSGIFSNFLSFVIPLIIMGFIINGIASLGNKSGKTLAITTILAYVSTIIAGLIAFTAGRVLLPKFISGSDNLIGKGVDVIPYFTINMPPIMEVMSALVLAFLLGIGISKIKNSSLLKVSEEFNSCRYPIFCSNYSSNTIINS